MPVPPPPPPSPPSPGTRQYHARLEGDPQGELIPLTCKGDPQVDDFVRLKDPAGEQVLYALIVSRTWENVEEDSVHYTLAPVLLLREMTDLQLVRR